MTPFSGRSGNKRRGFRNLLRLMIAPLLLVSAFSVAAFVGPTSAAASGLGKPYYLALGDSLAQGVQPDSLGNSVPTNTGYVDDLYGSGMAVRPKLQLAKIGCPGETTTSLIDGTSNPIDALCGYSAGASQLDAAKAFLGTHKVAFVTIDIGANDVDGCITKPDPQACVVAALPVMAANLGFILFQLRLASPTVHIYGMNYYDPFLAAWLSPGGALGQGQAHLTEVLTEALNITLQGVYSHFAIKVANVQLAFQTADFDIVPAFNLPVNVIEICVYTWMCAPSPQGPNIHATDVGYSVIAGAFLQLNPNL